MTNVNAGSRVYVVQLQMFGDVVKTKTLGTNGVVVQCDDGTLRVLYGEDSLKNIVDKSTSKNGHGEISTVPTDVKEIGPMVLEQFGVDEETRASLFQKFMALENGLRSEKAAYWEANHDQSAVMSKFLPELLDLLKSDGEFIATKSAKWLRHLDNDLRQNMLTKMMASTTSDERNKMILHFTEIQNDKIKVGEFIQDLYHRLMDNKTYVAMELAKAIASQVIHDPVTKKSIVAFVEDLSESRVDEIAMEWRRRKFYRSGTGGRYAQKVINNMRRPIVEGATT